MTSSSAAEQKIARQLVQGNEACALGALYAGCSFYAGYPITPSTEIMEIMARELPKRNGSFIQMEDEIASMAAVIGASWAGAKAMTATSGPGFSLMQENLGYAAITETPCVVVDSQRWGPSTGQPTKTAQGDVMQARWGTHGDHPIIVLTASNVFECFEMAVTAFNCAEKYRVPVVLLLDEVLSHMREGVRIPEPGEFDVVDRRRPDDVATFHPFEDEAFLPFGEGQRFNVTGMAHDQSGFPVQGSQAEEQLLRLLDRIESHKDQLVKFKFDAGEGELDELVISYGITSRASQNAVLTARKSGHRMGLLDLKTLWPFADSLIREIVSANGIKRVFVAEHNFGQLVREVERAIKDSAAVSQINRVDGYLLTPDQILAGITG